MQYRQYRHVYKIGFQYKVGKECMTSMNITLGIRAEYSGPSGTESWWENRTNIFTLLCRSLEQCIVRDMVKYNWDGPAIFIERF